MEILTDSLGVMQKAAFGRNRLEVTSHTLHGINTLRAGGLSNSGAFAKGTVE